MSVCRTCESHTRSQTPSSFEFVVLNNLMLLHSTLHWVFRMYTLTPNLRAVAACSNAHNCSHCRFLAVVGGLGELGLGGEPSQPPQAQQPSFQDPFGAPAPSPSNAPQQAPLPTLLSADKGKGLTLRGQIVRMDGRVGRFDAC